MRTYMGCSGATSICTWEVVEQGTYIFKKFGFLEEQLSDGLEKMQVRGPNARYACVEKFRVITPTSLVKILLIQQLREGRWKNWMEKFQQYDIEIKPLKAIRGQGLCNIITWTDSLNVVISISTRSSTSTPERYKYMVFYLKSVQFPNGMSPKEGRELTMKQN
jgi:hypothetical protein